MGADNKEKKQPHLKEQDATSVDPAKLTALTPEVVSIYDCYGVASCGFQVVEMFLSFVDFLS